MATSGGGSYILKSAKGTFKTENKNFENNNIFAYVEGRMFDSWIERSMTFESDYTTNILTTLNTYGNADNHYWYNNQPVRLTTTGTLPSGLAINTTYYIKKISDSTLQLMDARNGVVIVISNNGTGTHTIKRYTGFASGDLIENPAYIVESILRDEIFTERDLIAESGAGINSVKCSNLLGSTQDYYKYAIYHDIDLDVDIIIRSYDETTKSFTLESNLSEVSDGHKFYITNIQADEKINTSSFDLAAYKRTGSVHAIDINQIIKSNDLLEKLLFECHCSLIQTPEGIKLITLEGTTQTALISEDGYHLIYNASQFVDIGDDLTLNYRLMDNIDLSSITDFSMFNGTFSGILDGNGYTLSGFTQTNYLQVTGTDYRIGIFRDISGTVKNLKITSPNFTKTDSGNVGGVNFYSGILTSKITNASAVIENVIVDNPVIYNNLSHLYFAGIYRCGIISGYVNANATIKNCGVNNLNINISLWGDRYVGGLIGDRGYGKGYVEECYTTGMITSSSKTSGAGNIGGLIGDVNIGNVADYIKNCYSIVNINSNSLHVGGLFGVADTSYANQNRITKSYSVGQITAVRSGGTTGDLETLNISTLYFDSDVYGSLTDPGYNTPLALGVGANAKTTTEMKTQSTFTGWDFTNIWKIDPAINGGYPYLQNTVVTLGIRTKFSKPLKKDGRVLFDLDYTPLTEVYNYFKLRYAYDYAKGDHTKEIYVSDKGYTTGETDLADYQALCIAAKTNYKVNNKYEKSLDSIYDDDTAKELLKKLVLKFTKQRMIINYSGDLANHSYFEIGDQVILNFSGNYLKLIPDGVNKNTVFLITQAKIDIVLGSPKIDFVLEEVPIMST
jgi:hypothetical protein